MRLVCELTMLGLSCGLLALAAAQQSKDRPTAKDDKANSSAVKELVDRMMAFDKNKDGKLTKDEITDRRLQRVFDRADADKDGVVTKEELTAWAKRTIEGDVASRRGGFGAPGGRGGPGGFGAPPRPGQILPSFLQERLKLTAEQKKQLDGLQKEVDGKLDKILTAEQKKQLKEMREGFGRGGPGGPGGSGGRGPGGPLPDGDGPPQPRR